MRSANLSKRTGFASVLWSSCLAMLAVGANGTAIMAALPTMQTELSLSSAGVQWAVNAYLVVSAACIVLGGQAADRFGARLATKLKSLSWIIPCGRRASSHWRFLMSIMLLEWNVVLNIRRHACAQRGSGLPSQSGQN